MFNGVNKQFCTLRLSKHMSFVKLDQNSQVLKLLLREIITRANEPLDDKIKVTNI